MENYEIERILARGAFGTVYLCRSKIHPRKQVVIKQLSVDMFNNSDRNSTLSETRVLSMLRHPNIIKYYDSFLSTDGTLMYIVMEFAPGGTLFDMIDERRKLLGLAKFDESTFTNAGYLEGNLTIPCQINCIITIL